MLKKSPITKNTLRSLGILLISLFLSSCSVFSLVYDNLNWIISYQIDEIFDLNDEQKSQLDPKLDEILQWHRQNRISPIINFLTDVEKRLDNQIQSEDLKWFEQTIREEYKLYVTVISKKVAPIIAQLTTSQLITMQDYFKEHNEENQEILELSTSEYQEERLENISDSLENWIGDLTTSQTIQLQQLTQQLTDLRKARFKFQQFQQQNWYTLLHNHIVQSFTNQQNLPQLIQSMIALSTRANITENTPLMAQYIQQSTANRLLRTSYLIKIFNNLNSEQRQHLKHQIADYRKVLSSLQNSEQQTE